MERSLKNHSSVTTLLLFIIILFTQCTDNRPEDIYQPDLLYADGLVMKSMKQDYLEADEKVVPLINKLIHCADSYMDQSPHSVMEKEIIPPSGDKHDYISQGPYWWPDTTKPDGLPYIRRDGVVNPEREKFTDRKNLRDLIDASEFLGKAYYFTNDEKYATKIIQLLQVWFLDEATKMNPNLEYGQGIPGITEGRGIGIIETAAIGRIADVINLVRISDQWTPEPEAGMGDWLGAYLSWLLNSEKGKDESIHPNNHGTWYDVQTISLAIFTDQDRLARQIAERAKSLRIDEHIMEDGSQPHELARTVSFGYSAMNLRGLFHLAYIAEKVGVDLWNYENVHGATLQNALDFLIPAATGEQEWKYEQIRPIESNALNFQLLMASKVYDGKYKEIYNQLNDNHVEIPCDDVHLYFY